MTLTQQMSVWALLKHREQIFPVFTSGESLLSSILYELILIIFFVSIIQRIMRTAQERLCPNPTKS